MTETYDPSFDTSQTQNYTLSIRLLPSGFCFAVFDNEKKLIALVDTNLKANASDDLPQCEKNISSLDLLQHNFAHIHFLVDSNQYTLLPQPAFIAREQENIWKLNFSTLAPNKVLQHDAIRLSGIENIYAIDKDLLNLLQNAFDPQPRLIHRLSVQITMAIMRNKQANRRQLFIHVNENYFDAILLDLGQVILANTYEYKTEDEFLFFVLNIFNQLKVDPYNTEVKVGGTTNDSLIRQLSKYIENVNAFDFLQRNLLPDMIKTDITTQNYVLLNLPFATN